LTNLLYTEVVYVDVFIVDIRDEGRTAIVSFYLERGAEFPVSQASDELTFSFARLFFIHQISNRLFFCAFRINQLVRSEAPQDLVLDFQEVHSQRFIQRVTKILRHEVKCIQH